jgi:hypothetical protein
MNNYQLENQTIVIFVLKKNCYMEKYSTIHKLPFLKKSDTELIVLILFKMIANQPLVELVLPLLILL